MILGELWDYWHANGIKQTVSQFGRIWAYAWFGRNGSPQQASKKKISPPRRKSTNDCTPPRGQALRRDSENRR